MSDFDKEAERERLREKYERDKQKRETTEKMSELLLQGATMTNAHCSECNDPIFRYDGQEFCATCEKPVDRDTAEESDEQAAEEQENGQSGDAIEVTSPSDDARVSFGSGTGESEEDTAAEDASREQVTEGSPQEQPARTGRDQPAGHDNDATRRETGGRQPREQPAARSRDSRQPVRGSRAGEASGDADIGAVRDSLVRTLRRFSEQAEACEDPQRAREHLAAAREAAETLEALRR